MATAVSRQSSTSSGRDVKKSTIRRQSSSAVPFSTGHCAKELWVPDRFVTECAMCNAGFTFSRRRHHCRMCGNISHGEPCANRLGTTPENAKGTWICKLCEAYYGTHCETLYSGCQFMMSMPDGNWRGVRVWLTSEGSSMQLNWEATKSRVKPRDFVIQQSISLIKTDAVESIPVQSVMKDPVPYIRIKTNDDVLLLEAFSKKDYSKWMDGLLSAHYVCHQEQRLEEAQKQLELNDSQETQKKS